MDSYIKWLIYLAILIIAFAVVVFAYNVAFAQASTQVPHHYHFGNWNYGTCIQTKCGDATGTQDKTRTCNDFQMGWAFGNHGCVFGTTQTESVACGVKEPTQCEEEGICPTECGLTSSEVADGQGGTKVCEATPACVVPTPIKKKVKSPDLDFTQGSDKGTGDGIVKLKWKNFKDCSKVKIAIATDGVFGNGHKTIKTEDDGSYWFDSLVTFWAKIRCAKSGSEWSDVEKIQP